MLPNFQDNFLTTVRKEKTPLTIFLTNGFQIRGIIRAYDLYVLIVESEGKQLMIYKHAVSTITPMKPVRFTSNKPEGQKECTTNT